MVVQACVKEAKWRPSTTRLPIPFVWAGERKNNPNFSHRKPSHDPQNWDIGASLRPKLLVYSTTWEPSKNSLMGGGIRAPSWLWRRKLIILNNKGMSRGLGGEIPETVLLPGDVTGHICIQRWYSACLWLSYCCLSLITYQSANCPLTYHTDNTFLFTLLHFTSLDIFFFL